MQPCASFWKFSFIYTSVRCLGDSHFKYVFGQADLLLMYAISMNWCIAFITQVSPFSVYPNPEGNGLSAISALL